ncbi:MAG: hypothetical protein OXD38_08510 [Aestuariivita sp.]|nr:hypothetical protein [Aestuariivita sp.]
MRVYGLPLADNWQVLCAEPLRGLGDSPPFDLAANETPSWAPIEYGRSRLRDTRLRARLLSMGEAWYEWRGAGVAGDFSGPSGAESRLSFLIKCKGERARYF